MIGCSRFVRCTLVYLALKNVYISIVTACQQNVSEFAKIFSSFSGYFITVYKSDTFSGQLRVFPDLYHRFDSLQMCGIYVARSAASCHTFAAYGICVPPPRHFLVDFILFAPFLSFRRPPAAQVLERALFQPRNIPPRLL